MCACVRVYTVCSAESPVPSPEPRVARPDGLEPLSPQAYVCACAVTHLSTHMHMHVNGPPVAAPAPFLDLTPSAVTRARTTTRTGGRRASFCFCPISRESRRPLRDSRTCHSSSVVQTFQVARRGAGRHVAVETPSGLRPQASLRSHPRQQQQQRHDRTCTATSSTATSSSTAAAAVTAAAACAARV